MSEQPAERSKPASTSNQSGYAGSVKNQLSAFTPPTEEEVSKALRSLHSGQYWWNKINSIILEQVFMQGFHDRQSELRLRMIERFNFVSPVDRLPVLTDPVFSQLKQVQFSAHDRKNLLDAELRKRVRSYAHQVRTGDLSVYQQIPSVIVPLVLAETSQSTQSTHTSLQSPLTNFLAMV